MSEPAEDAENASKHLSGSPLAAQNKKATAMDPTKPKPGMAHQLSQK